VEKKMQKEMKREKQRQKRETNSEDLADSWSENRIGRLILGSRPVWELCRPALKKIAARASDEAVGRLHRRADLGTW
jgi:hypothetical protein